MNPITDLAIYKPEQYNVLAVQEDLQPRQHMLAEVVQVKIDPNPRSGDVHQIDRGLSPARPAVDRIAAALGIVFDPDRTEVEKLSRTEWRGKAIGARRNADGTWSVRSGEYEWDAELRAEIDELNAEKKGKAFDLRARILENRRFGRQRAETGARLRAIRALTGIKTSYTAAELQKPLVFVRQTILGSAPVHMMLGAPSWSGPQQVTALPAPADDAIPLDVEAEELPPEEEAEAELEPVAAAAPADDELPPAEDELPPADELPPDDTNVDPIGEAAIELGMQGPPDQEQYPHSYRLIELYVDPRSERIRHQVKGMLGEELTESQAAQICRRIENYHNEQQRRQQQ